MKSRYIIVYFLAVLWLYPTVAFACRIDYRPAEELKNESKLVVLVTVDSKKVSPRSQMGELYSYEVTIESTERGKSVPDLSLVSYHNYRMLKIDGMITCPLKDGSGLETDLKIGGKYRLFLKSPEEKTILFSELVESGDEQEKTNLLTNVANCFHIAVRVLKDQPSASQQLGAFLLRAKNKLKSPQKTAFSCDVSRLKWDSTGERLLSKEGKEILFRIANQQWNHFDDGASFTTKYEFFIPQEAGIATAVIDLSMQSEVHNK